MGFPRTLIILLAAGILTGCAAGKAYLSPDQFRDLATTTLTGEIPEIEITGTDSLSINFDWKEFTVIAEIEEEYEAYLNNPRRLGKILAGMVQEFLDYDFSSVEPRPLEDEYIVPVFLRYDIIKQLATGNDGEETTTESFLVTEYAPGLYLTIVYYKDRRFSLIKNFVALQREMEPAQMYRWATGNIESLIENDYFYTEGDSTFYYRQDEPLLGASMLLCPQLWEDLPVDSEHLVFAVPTTSQLIFADRRSRSGMAKLMRMLKNYSGSEVVFGFHVSDRLYERRDGRIVEYDQLNLFKPGLGRNQ